MERLIVKEKCIAIQNNKYEKFMQKWEDFRYGIYDFIGPDPLW